MGRYQPRHREGVKHMGGESGSTTNPKKGRTGKLKINYEDRPSNASTVDKNIHTCMATDEALIGL